MAAIASSADVECPATLSRTALPLGSAFVSRHARLVGHVTYPRPTNIRAEVLVGHPKTCSRIATSHCRVDVR